MISVEELSRQVADLCPEDHLKSFLRRDCRPDGRALDECRPIIVADDVVNSCDRTIGVDVIVFMFNFRVSDLESSQVRYDS